MTDEKGRVDGDDFLTELEENEDEILEAAVYKRSEPRIPVASASVRRTESGFLALMRIVGFVRPRRTGSDDDAG